MRKKPIRLMCLAVMLLCITVILYRVNYNEEDIDRMDSEAASEWSAQGMNDFLPVQLRTGSGGSVQNIKLFRTQEICYAFLPAYADLSGLVCSYEAAVSSVSLDGQIIPMGQTLESVETGRTYELVITDREHNVLQYPLVFLQSENIPAVFIDTSSGSMDYVNAVKGNEEPGHFTCITAEGAVDSQSVVSRIKGRGNTSWSSNGKRNQYNVRLKETVGVLGMDSARNWVLQSNKFDDSMMKNKLSYDFARDIGVPYAVDSKFADLYLNGEYMGTYLICEKVEVAENRIDTSNQYMIERDDRTDPRDKNAVEREDSQIPQVQSVETPYGYFAVHNPENMSEGENSYITDYLGSTSWSIENAQNSDDFINYIDVDSFAKLYIMNEISNDPDANRLSSFYYKEDERNSKLTAGPVWDFDWAYGYDARSQVIEVSGFDEGWFVDLYKSEMFQSSLCNTFRTIMQEIYPNYNKDYFEEMKNDLLPSYCMTMIRWQESEDTDSAAGRLKEAVDALQEYFTKRIEYLGKAFSGSPVYHKVNFVYPGGKAFTHTYVKKGDAIPEGTAMHLLSVYGCVPCILPAEDDSEIDWRTYAISEDTDIECRAPEPGNE